jgi:hypothetical protein
LLRHYTAQLRRIERLAPTRILKPEGLHALATVLLIDIQEQLRTEFLKALGINPKRCCDLCQNTLLVAVVLKAESTDDGANGTLKVRRA